MTCLSVAAHSDADDQRTLCTRHEHTNTHTQALIYNVAPIIRIHPHTRCSNNREKYVGPNAECGRLSSCREMFQASTVNYVQQWLGPYCTRRLLLPPLLMFLTFGDLGFDLASWKLALSAIIRKRTGTAEKPKSVSTFLKAGLSGAPIVSSMRSKVRRMAA